MTNALNAELIRMLEQGRALQREGRLNEAMGLCQSILKKAPTHFDVLNLLGVLSGQSGNLGQAVEYFDKAISVMPDNPSSHINRGLALKELKYLDAALACFNTAIALRDDDSVAYYLRSNVYKELGQLQQALTDCDTSIALHAGFALSHFNRGIILQHMQKLELALASYERAVELQPDYAEAHVNRGYLLHQLGRIEEAVSSYENGIAIKPDPAAYLHLGNALKDLNRHNEALDCYDLAIDLKPNYSEAFNNRGVVQNELGNIADSLASYGQAILINPGYAEAYFNRASVLRSVQRFEEAVADFERAASLQPEMKFLSGALIEARLQICDWHQIDSQISRVETGVGREDAISHPFAFLTFSDDLQLQRKAAEIFVREACPMDASLDAVPTRKRTGRIRIGYFSADFREHPVSRLLVGLIEAHDRSDFEILAFSFGKNTQDPMRKRMELSFDQFIDVRAHSDLEIAMLARNHQIDVAVDLGGYTAGSRTRIFALRAAPIQVNYLGYPGTMGSGYVDYLVADELLVPADAQKHYSEKIIYLPCFQANDSKREISDRIFTRAELHLPPSGFVFCCFNSSYKIMPGTFGSWMRILSRVPSSVLFLDAKTEAIEHNLRREARDRGIAPNRIIFGKPLTLPDWLARHHVADLFLDTLPYNAGTTASDALWTGLPVLTRVGSSFSGRMAASLLSAIDLPELITWSAQQYEDLAVDLAMNPRRLADIRRRLTVNRATKSLFDQKLFTCSLESAYKTIIERQIAGLPPDHVRIS